MTELTKAYGYLRVSSDGQVKYWNGINGQRWAIEQFADRKWYYVEDYFIDDWVSGKLASRKWLNEMLQALKTANRNPAKPKIKHVIVDDIDRIARDIWVWVAKKAEIEATGATIISLKQTLEDTPESRLQATITMATKQYERENNWRRVRSRQEQRLRDWYWCFQLPVWYKFVKAPTWWWMVVVPDEPNFTYISDWLKLLANWTLPTQAALIKYLNERWAKTHSWWKINDKFMSRIINKWNLPLYAGYVNFPKWWVDMVKWKHKAAITESEFHKIATKFKMRDFFKEYSPSDISETLPLRYILHCWCCWWVLSWSVSKWNWWQYFYYYCINKKCECYRKSTMYTKIHSDVENFLGDLQLDENCLNSIKIVVDAFSKDRWALKANQKKEIEKRIKNIDLEMERLLEKITNTNSDFIAKKLEEKMVSLEDEKTKLKWELTDYDNTTVNCYEDNFNILKAVIQSPLKIWKQSDTELKKLLLNGIFNWTLCYSRGVGARTKETPVIYAKKDELERILNEFQKTGERTTETSILEPIKKNKSISLG